MSEVLFSVTANDCDWKYQRGSGNGGQKKNKTSSAVRCTHRASGATGFAEDSRSQHINKQIAFKRMSDTEQFKRWHKTETLKRLGVLFDVEEKVEREMRKIKVECVENGKWVPYKV